MNIRQSTFKPILRWLLSILLGILSMADKHFSVFYLGAPALLSAAPLIHLSPHGVFLGQMLMWFGGGWDKLPLLALLYIFPLAFPRHARMRRRPHPAVIGGIICLWESGRCLLTSRPLNELILGWCGGILCACVLFFMDHLHHQCTRRQNKDLIALLIGALWMIVVCDSRWLGGLTTQCITLLLILGAATLGPWQGMTGGCLLSLAASGICADLTLLPLFLSAVLATTAMRRWGRKVDAAAVLMCCELSLLPAGQFLETPWRLLSPPLAVVLFLLSPWRPAPKKSTPAVPDPVSQYEALVQQVEDLRLHTRGRMKFFPDIAERAAALLQEAGATGISATCAADPSGGFFLDVCFEGILLRESVLLGLMERAAARPLSVHRCFLKEESSCACFVRRPPLRVECAALCKTKGGEMVCGDGALAFSADQSHYVLLLSDGMGSGTDAFAQSSWTLSLMQKLLRSGLEAESAMEMVHSSLRLAHEEIVFATADLCTIDLFTGEARFVKAGAVSAFILQESGITQVGGTSMPLGAAETADMLIGTHHLHKGDVILLISDGAYEHKDDILYTLQKHQSLPINELTRRLIRCALPDTGEPTDDVTVLAARIIDNNGGYV